MCHLCQNISSTPSDHDPVRRLRSTLTENLPYCSGTLDVQPRSLMLYYGKGTQTRRIDLLRATIDELGDALEKAYRKAGKMEVDEFMLGFDAERAGLIETIHSFLFYGAEEEKFVKAEFKVVQTERMREWTFDSGVLLSEAEPGAGSRIAFASFFSDVEHEVTPVKTGYRLSVTYNLYFSPTRTGHFSAPSSGLCVLQPSGANTSAVSSALTALLTDGGILPEGGTLGFGLQHQYPLPKSWIYGDNNPLEALQDWLKGNDAALFRACTAHGLTPLLRLVYEDDGEEPIFPILLKEAIEVSGYDLEEDDTANVICDEWGGVVMLCRSLFPDSVLEKECRDGKRRKYLQRLEDRYEYEYLKKETACLPSKTVHMVTEMTRFNELKSTMIVHMGNDAGICHMYKYVCLIVDVGPTGKRSEIRLPERKNERSRDWEEDETEAINEGSEDEE